MRSSGRHNRSKVTVLMSVYNGEEYLTESIESILNQTFSDFEFLIIDDGSKDMTLNILTSYNDERIKIIKNKENLGLIASLNKGLELSQGKYIARMDADDISLPQRLEKQVNFMDQNPEIGVSSAWLKKFGDGKEKVWKSPVKHKNIIAKMFSNSSVWHAVAMIRKKLLDEHKITYNENYIRAEDYKLWTDLANTTKFFNIPEVLYLYRFHPNQEIKKENTAHKVREELVEQFLGRPLTLKERKLHEYLHFEAKFEDAEIIQDINEWIIFLKKKNKEYQKYAEPTFSESLDKVLNNTKRKCFYYSLRNNHKYKPSILKKLFSVNNKLYKGFGYRELLKIIVKSLMFYKNKYTVSLSE